MPDQMAGHDAKHADETLDVLACGGIEVYQKKKGYRYSLDAYLLAAFVEEAPGTRVLEIGSGSGVVAMMLASVKKLVVTGVEIQEDLAEMSVRSVVRQGLQDRVTIVCSDIRDYRGPKVDALVANPPFRPLGSGRVNPDSQKAIARHEIKLDLDALLAKSYELLKHRGRMYLVYPTWRLADALGAMRKSRIEPKRVRFVHSHASSHSEICLLCGMKGGGKGIAVDPPVTVYNADGSYHPDVERAMRELRLDKKALT